MIYVLLIGRDSGFVRTAQPSKRHVQLLKHPGFSVVKLGLILLYIVQASNNWFLQLFDRGIHDTTTCWIIAEHL